MFCIRYNARQGANKDIYNLVPRQLYQVIDCLMLVGFNNINKRRIILTLKSAWIIRESHSQSYKRHQRFYIVRCSLSVLFCKLINVGQGHITCIYWACFVYRILSNSVVQRTFICCECGKFSRKVNSLLFAIMLLSRKFSPCQNYTRPQVWYFIGLHRENCDHA